MSAERGSIYTEDGASLTPEARELFTQDFGLQEQDVLQEVAFGTYSGKLADALYDPKCPVGGIIQNAYKSGGIDGVIEKFNGLRMFAPDFQVTISEETIDYHKKKQNQEVQIFPPTHNQ